TINNGALVIGTPAQFSFIRALVSDTAMQHLGEEGFIIRTATTGTPAKKIICITANTDAGVLYGVFHFLRLLQTHQSIEHLAITSAPRIANRMLNHWDNLNR